MLVSVIELMLKGMGIGWTYILLAGLLVLALPFVYLAIRIGPVYRVRRQKLREIQMARAVMQEEGGKV